MSSYLPLFENSFRNASVLVTGHTGFKGSWLSWWLVRLGAKVTGMALPPQHQLDLCKLARLEDEVRHHIIDIRDEASVTRLVRDVSPNFIFHLAAQALVRDSYANPIDTVSTNIMGTANILEAVRKLGQPCAVVIVTSDKCYENAEWSFGYRENDPMGGHDIYSASKGCAELMVAAYRKSFFPVDRLPEHGVTIASARAGNVIGPGDWAKDRIVPDAVRALIAGEAIPVRNPYAVRPWQHVLESLSGYLWLGALLAGSEREQFGEAWNFGPHADREFKVQELVELFIERWGRGQWVNQSEEKTVHEANTLRLAIDKAIVRLGWSPVWGFHDVVHRTAEGYRELIRFEKNTIAIRTLMDNEITHYTNGAASRGLRWAATNS